MDILSENWTPEWGNNHAWIAMDVNGYLAIMQNNGWGWLPGTLIRIPDINNALTELFEFVYSESPKYENLINKNGHFDVDLFSYWRLKNSTKEDVIKAYQREIDRGSKSTDALLASQKGLFLFEAVEGYSPDEDYPVGYSGKTKMGDYYRNLIPTIYATIEDIPEPLRQYIVVSDSLDFTQDRLLDNDKISEYFTRMHS